jgi:hypothetical protein
VEQFVAAHRTARRLGARPLLERVSDSLTALGEQADRRLGRRAVAQRADSGLTRREVEVVRLVAGGRYLVCPICFDARKLDKGQLVATAELGGTVPMWEWIGDDGATTFSY